MKILRGRPHGGEPNYDAARVGLFASRRRNNYLLLAMFCCRIKITIYDDDRLIMYIEAA